ncbi:MAG: hypothetical protein KC492_26540, partial [Myxococcales bacterium]|nr:hypothetical protein [Myxococcales bacterium]
DCVCLSEAEVQAEPSAFDRLRGVCRCLAVTRGAQGASVYVQDRRLDVGVIDASVCDTTGAGDVFAGALMATLAQNLELEQAVRLASVAAGLSTEQRGPCPLDRERLFALAESVQLTLRAP